MVVCVIVRRFHNNNQKKGGGPLDPARKKISLTILLSLLFYTFTTKKDIAKLKKKISLTILLRLLFYTFTTTKKGGGLLDIAK